jgi:hypothetical protein
MQGMGVMRATGGKFMNNTENDNKQSSEDSLIIDVDYNQYYLQDSSGDFDARQSEFFDDGIVAPLGNGIRIICGTEYGQLGVTFRVMNTLDGLLRGPGVAAECDLLLPSGIAILTNVDGELLHEHNFGRPLRCRVLVRVSGRDEAAMNFDETMLEHHVITLAPTSIEQARWRSAAMDNIGFEFEAVTEHVARP